MLSESWLKGKLSTHKGQIGSEEKADNDSINNQMTLIAKMYRLKLAQKNLNIHVIIHHI